MFKNRVMLVLSFVVVLSMVLAACAPKEVIKTVEVTKVVTQKETQVVKETSLVKETQIVEITATPEAVATAVPVTRKGAWVDTIVFTEQNSAEAAVKQLQAGELDLYAYTVADPKLFEVIKSDPLLGYSNSVGSSNELTFNPATFTNGKLNPFTSPKVREAMNMLIDRNYIVQEIFGGLAQPKLFALVSSFPDYAKYVDVARELEAAYAYNPDKAKTVISEEVTAMGATLVDGKWQFNGEAVTIIILIRTEDKRRIIGDYVANQLETIGFTVDRQYKTRSEASPIWVQGNPTDGLFHIYTGGWITTAVSRDDGSNFSFYYTPRDYPIALWQVYTPTAEFDEVALKLRNNDFNTMEERKELFGKAMRLSLQDSVRVWCNDQLSFTPEKANIQVAYDLAGAVAGSVLYPFTLRYKGAIGGTVKIAQPGILVDPWNPVGGSNWIYDMMPIRATSDRGVITDPYTGLAWPQRVEKAELTIVTGLPVAKTLDWIDMKSADKIEVPTDAWADWDAVNQKFITVGEKYTETLTAKTKQVVYYPEDLFKVVKWHDGSPLSVGDFVMNMITTFDYGKEGSANYDAAQAETLAAFMSTFKAVKIVSTFPLVIETYNDQYALDAELTVTTWFPVYTYGPGPWHTVAMGNLADASTDKKTQLSFSAAKAEEKEGEWMSFIAGPSLEILKAWMDKAATDSFLPYAPTMSQFVTPAEVTARWTNLQAWYALRGHFWVGTGPFYLYKVYPTERTLTLQRTTDFPDMADKWSNFGTPKLAEVEVNGPSQVKIGDEVKVDVAVTFDGDAYPSAEITGVKWLLFDANQALVGSGDGVLVTEGQYQVTLPKDVSAKLVAGSNKLEVVVTSLLVAIPTFGTLEFVTTQ